MLKFLNRSRGIVHVCTFLKTHETLLPISKFQIFYLTQIASSISRVHYCPNEVEGLRHRKLIYDNQDSLKNSEETKVRILNQFPEWLDLMNLLLNRGYLDKVDNLFRNGQVAAKEFNAIRTAYLNFGRDHYNLIRYLSKNDLEIIIGNGCPNSDRKVVNSGKRLRAHVGIDETNVCKSCNLRGDCTRAFVKAREDRGGRTIDVMRILFTYGLVLVANTLANRQCVEEVVYNSVRKLVKEVVELTIKGIDSDLPITKDSKGFSEIQRNCSRREEREMNSKVKHGNRRSPRQPKVPNDLKKGDWLCNKCNFLNFAKNTICLQCKERPPKQQLGPGEWQCDSCNYINFRRNMICLRCDYKRPKASYSVFFSGPHALKDQHQISFSHFDESNGRVKDQYFTLVNKNSENIGSNTSRSSENERENESKYSCHEVAKSISCSKSEISDNMQRRCEKQRKETTARWKSMQNSADADDQFWSADMQSDEEIWESTDAEEIFECTDDEETNTL